MIKKPVLISLILLAAIGGGVLFLLSRPADQTDMQPSVTTPISQAPSTSSTENTETKPAITPGQYIDYTAEAVAATAGTKLLFFHAPWCPQCRALEADIKQSGVPDGVTIMKVDFDSSRSLKSKYGVTLQTTIVKIDDAGELVAKYVAYDDPTLAAVTKNLL